MRLGKREQLMSNSFLIGVGIGLGIVVGLSVLLLAYIFVSRLRR